MPDQVLPKRGLRSITVAGAGAEKTFARISVRIADRSLAFERIISL